MNTITLDRGQIKREALAINKNAKVSAYLFTLLWLGIVLILNTLYGWVSGSTAAQITQYADALGGSISFTLHTPDFPAGVVTFVTVVVSLLTSILSAGYALYILGIRRGQHMGYGTLFDGFAFAGKIILLDIVMSLFIILWTLLFIIPGIIAAYRYSFALYNLCENPEIGVMEAISLSKEQTRGYKWQLFVLDLSFIGWAILSALTLGILNIWLTPYMLQSRVGYFQKIKEIKHIGYFPPSENDGRFHSDERFAAPDEHKPYDPEL